MCRRGAALFVLALQPSMVSMRAAVSLLRRQVLVRPSPQPYFSASLLCQVSLSCAQLSATSSPVSSLQLSIVGLLLCLVSENARADKVPARNDMLPET